MAMRLTRMLLVVVVALFAIVPAARAATFTVLGTDDPLGASCSGLECESLRAAVDAAAFSVGEDTIVLEGDDYQLEQGQLVIGTDVKIDGAGARFTTIRGNPQSFRVLEVAAGATVAVSGVTLRDGYANPTPGNSGFRPGGLVRNYGALSLDRVRVTGGNATSGGGIANTGGTLTIDRSLIDDNNGGEDAGGLLSFGGGTVHVRNTTIAYNTAAKGGGYYSWSDSGHPNANNALLEQVTIAWNGTGGVGWTGNDILRVKASVIASNAGGNCAEPFALANASISVESGTDCNFALQNEQSAVSDALQNLGGDTDVLRIPSESGANNFVTPTDCLPTDQRGVPRATTMCEAGAFEDAVATPTIAYPAEDGWVNDEPLTIDGAGVAADAVVEVVGTTQSTNADANGRWSLDVGFLPQGTHQLTLRARYGDYPSEPVTVRFNVDRERPWPIITSHPPAVTNRSEVTFKYRLEDDEPVTYECRLFGPGLDLDPEPCAADGQTYADLEDGEYRFEVWARDRAGNTNEGTVDFRFEVDRDLIEAPQVSAPTTEPTAAAFTFSTAQPDRALTCRLEGPGRDATFAPCASPQRYEGLAAGAYRFTVRSSDAQGNFADAPVREFTIAGEPPVVLPEQTPTPTPIPTPTPPPPATPTPQPEAGEHVVIRPTKGIVKIQLPGSKQFVELRSIDDIPLGATIDTKFGRIQLRFESEPGKVQSATFYGGIFQIRQIGKVLDLKLTEALAACPKKNSGRKASSAQSKKKKVKKRKLWGDGKGRFRTSGRHSAATVRGTKWLVEDSCSGTLTRVTAGVVAVRHGKKTILVRAGKRYLAKPR
jgi:hypothetical protein